MSTAETTPTFSIIEGGPAQNTLRRLNLAQPLSDAALLRVAALLVLVTWVPLALLALAQGLALQATVVVPFIRDISTHVRFLLVVPILVVAEGAVGARIRVTVGFFVAARLIRDDDRDRLARIIAASVDFRDSRLGAIILLAIVALWSWTSAKQGIGGAIAAWHAPWGNGGLSLAGYWYAIVCLPILYFLILRWIYRLLVWAFLLRQIAKLDLNLTSSHPDGAGGLAFLGRVLPLFGAIVFAMNAIVSSRIATRVLFGGTIQYDDLGALAFLIALELAIFAGPLALFIPKLYGLREEGLRQYGALSTRYTRLFEEKWIRGGAGDEPLLGTSDIQSLADLGNSYTTVSRMNVVPAGLMDLAWLAVPAILPALPLVLLVVPMSELLEDLVKLIA